MLTVVALDKRKHGGLYDLACQYFLEKPPRINVRASHVLPKLEFECPCMTADQIEVIVFVLFVLVLLDCGLPLRQNVAVEELKSLWSRQKLHLWILTMWLSLSKPLRFAWRYQ
jgi:hypothetical protein